MKDEKREKTFYSCSKLYSCYIAPPILAVLVHNILDFMKLKEKGYESSGYC